MSQMLWTEANGAWLVGREPAAPVGLAEAGSGTA
jgi:hypothetical protein